MASLSGANLQLTYRFPDSKDQIYTAEGLTPQNFTVGNGVEISDWSQHHLSFDFSPEGFIVVGGPSWISTPFGGFAISDLTNSLADIIDVKIFDQMGRSLEQSDVSWDANNIWVNWSGEEAVGQSPYVLFQVTLNEHPVVVNRTLTPVLAAGDLGAKLGEDDLKSSDFESSSLTYTVDDLPSGILLINGDIAAEGATFTQADIDSGRVSLLAGPVNPSPSVNTLNGPISGAGITFSDGFAFTVRDGNGAATSDTFKASYASYDTVQTAAQYGGYWGGNGNDYQRGTVNADNMSGGNGSDLMIGGSGNDQVSGGEGNNRVFGQNGDDNLSGGNGNDLLDGGAGHDQIHANGGNNWLFGGGGNDTMSAGEGNDWFHGGTGEDTINANGGNNRINGGAGADTITAGNGDDTVIAGAGNDIVYANGGKNKFQLGGISGFATDGSDQFTGGSGTDKYALYLNDRNGSEAGWGNDTINGFRIAEGDQLVAFGPSVGYWDNDANLASLVASNFVTASRGTGGNAGDLKLTFNPGGSNQSSVTLKYFFWDNGSYGTTSSSSAISQAQLKNILKDAVEDGGVGGSDFITKAHDYVSKDFLFV